MSRSVLQAKPFTDEAAAYEWVEARIWANGRVCPKCGVVDRSGPLKGKTNRIGLYKCYACRKPFTVKVGTIFEDSHVQMRDWLAAIYLICSSKKGISSNQLHRMLGVTLKTAWFMSHRIREAMRVVGIEPMGGAGEIIDPRPFAIGTIRDVYVRYPKLGAVLPAMGYGAAQIADLQDTINSTKAEVVLIATPIDLRRLIAIDLPLQRVRYDLQVVGSPTLSDIISTKFQDREAEISFPQNAGSGRSGD